MNEAKRLLVSSWFVKAEHDLEAARRLGLSSQPLSDVAISATPTPLTWEGDYAIALALRDAYPQVDLAQVSLRMIYDWTLALPDFDDDPALANDDILHSIYQAWFEEANAV